MKIMLSDRFIYFAILYEFITFTSERKVFY